MRVKEKITNYYDRYAAKYGNSLKAVNWSSRKNQELRFQQFLKFLPRQDLSINDIGCGGGDLVSYLRNFYTKEFSYTGYDLSSEMIAVAKEKYNQQDGINFKKISLIQAIEERHYSIASGVFNRRFLFPNKKKYIDLVYETLNVMWKRSEIGFGFNFLSDKKKPKRYDGLLYMNKNKVVEYCEEKFGANYEVLDSYHDIDVTIWIFKD